MKKFALYFDTDKEMEWLNKMAQEGYAMVDFFAGLYTFEPCEKGEWQYQIDIGNGFFGIFFRSGCGFGGLLCGRLGFRFVRLVRLVRPAGVDLASGVESAPGIKDRKKLEALFTELKGLDL